MRLTPLLCAAAALLTLAAGCGGGGGETSGGGDGHGGFADAANAACAKANREVAALTPPHGQAELPRYLGEAEAIVLRLRRELEKIDGADGARAYIAGLEKSGTVLNEMYDAAQSKNPDAVGELSAELAEIRLARLAREAGLEACAEQPTAQT